ncbi:MAG TPA: right-handed parallel beta-helix repeat-containing protein [Vicinamibacterales bacterium]
MSNTRRLLLLSLLLLAALSSFAQSAGPDVGLSILSPIIDPGLPFNFGILWFNNSRTNAASNATLTLVIPAGIRTLTLPGNCSLSGSTVTCSTGAIPAGKPVNFDTPDLVIPVTADDSTNGQLLPISGDIVATDAAGNASRRHAGFNLRVYRTFFVTDTQPDSLANAIDQANLACTDDYPCKVAFRLGTVPESGYFTLRPQRALPKITGTNISIDGTTQTRLTGNTNANGPEVFIDGRDSAWEDAFVFDEPCEAELAGLAIGNFKNAAVTMNGEADPKTSTVPCTFALYFRSVHDNFLGVDPSGTQAAPNGRGVVLNERLFSATAITNNLLSGNHHSGIWMGVAVRNAISGNTIGLDIHHQPLANGASGIYVGPNAFDADIRGNYIAFNHDFGIAIDRNAIGTDIGPNSIYANLQLGIDVGLDGPTPTRDVPAPVVLSAVYDSASDSTVVTISSKETANFISPTMTIYAADAPHPSGYGDGQYLLGTFKFNPTQGNIVFPAKGDWRGKWVSATVTRNVYFGFAYIGSQPNAEFPETHSTTSEFSRAVKVE